MFFYQMFVLIGPTGILFRQILLYKERKLFCIIYRV